MVLLGGALYDVTDPVHPRLLCQVFNTVAHLYTADTFGYLRRTRPSGTEVRLHSIRSGDLRTVAGWPLNLLDDSGRPIGTWTADGNSAAAILPGTDASGNQTEQVWLFVTPNKTELYEFPLPLTDCICRFGLPPPVLAFSADGQYLVSGWPIGKGATPMRIYRVSDGQLVQTLDVGDLGAVWSRTGHRLYLTSTKTWSPEDGATFLAGATHWPYMAGVSPDGSQVAYTAGTPDPFSQTDIRVFVYDLSRHTNRMLVDRPRSEVTFVKDGWVWYLEEGPCTDCPGPTGPTGKVFAVNLADGAEQTVVFAAGESPTVLQSGWGPGEFWPNS